MDKKNRYVANIFLLSTFFIYIVSIFYKNEYTWMGYVTAFAEAGMVGGIADWFAVTALFKHPFGLKIPHTAIIPNSKDKIGKNISNFFRENFLSESYIKENIEKYPISEKAGSFLINQKDNITVFAINALKETLQTFSYEKVQSYLVKMLKDKYEEVNFKTIIINALIKAKKNNKHLDVINFVLLALADWLKNPENNKKVTTWIKDAIKNDSHGKKTLFGSFKSLLVGEPDLMKNLLDFQKHLNSFDGRELRFQINNYFDSFLDYLENDKYVDIKLEELKVTVYNSMDVEKNIHKIINEIRLLVEMDLHSENSKIKNKIHLLIDNMANKLVNDVALKNHIKERIIHYVPKILVANGMKIDKFFMDYISKLNAKEISDMIENKVGNDLQYIRINGTIVGGLIGLSIYSVTHLIEKFL